MKITPFIQSSRYKGGHKANPISMLITLLLGMFGPNAFAV